MVVLTTAYIERECTRTQSIKSLTRTGIDEDHLAKMTHLCMNEKFVGKIGDFSICKNLKVMYLRNNRISEIINIDFATNLTHLYLEHNELTKIENLDGLRNLTKLCLGHNRIGVVEGLAKLEKLSELRIERQRLSPGNFLIFDPRTADALSYRLKVLNIAGNGITSLRPLRNFARLVILDAKDNGIVEIENLTECISGLRDIRELYLCGNPVTRAYGYRENLIANSDSLVNLDGKQISDVSRRFMKNFKTEKQQRLSRREPAKKTTLRDDITSSLRLPPAFERSVSRAIIQQQYPGPRFNPKAQASSSTIDTAVGSEPRRFPAWRSVSAITAAIRSARRAASARKPPAPKQSTGTTFTNVLPPIKN